MAAVQSPPQGKIENTTNLYEQAGSTYGELTDLLDENGILEEQPDIAQQLSDYGESIKNYGDVVKNEDKSKIDNLISELQALNDQINKIYDTFDASING